MRRVKGFTLVEIVIATSFVGLAFLLASSLLNLGTKSLGMATKEYDLQTSIRLAAQTATSKIRYSTAIFTIPKTSFRPDNLSTRWDYFGIEDTTIDSRPASQIVQYVWNESSATHKKTVIVEPRADITYSFAFFKDVSVSADSEIIENELLNFKIEGYLNGDTSAPYITIDGLALAANSLQIVESGTDLNRATAIAYRGEERPGAFVGHIAMILDCSGSMEYYMHNSNIAPVGQRRIDVLKDAAKTLLNNLGAYDMIDVSLIPFSSSANDPHPFRKTDADNTQLINAIDSLIPVGGTNTGDAIRRAYYQLKAHNATVPYGTAKNYLIVLVDGDTTMCSIRDWNSAARPYASDYFLSSGNIKNDSTWLYIDDTSAGSIQGSLRPFQIAGGGSFMTNLTTNYVNKCGSDFFSSTNFAKPFLIALSNSVSTDGLNNISGALNTPAANVFRADDSASLNSAFTSIMDEILSELWHLNGPSL
ncbi:MAG: VWA domain-containing protein [Clostridiales bacterium]|jgi:type II secretory pathway pseudopilin PulG/uncharacterized protein YegL|nr:VWA domain-containing protein [Clostridiales bacterium]